MNRRLATAFTSVVVICAVAVTVLVVRRELLGPRGGADALGAPIAVTDRLPLIDPSRQFGRSDASTTVVEFIDYQCPFCRRAERRVRQLMESYPGRFSISYRHFPRPSHAYAVDAAVAVECAASQGRFKAFHDALFADQASIGKRPWAELALAAGVSDTTTFSACLQSAPPLRRVFADKALGESIGVVGTPAFVFNGWLYVGLQGLDSLEAVLARP